MKIFEPPRKDPPIWIICLIIGFVAAFFATETENWIIKILCAGSGIALVILGLIDLFKGGGEI